MNNTAITILPADRADGATPPQNGKRISCLAARFGRSLPRDHIGFIAILFALVAALSGGLFSGFITPGFAAGLPTYQHLKSFGDPPPTGGLPLAGLIQGLDGALYGTTSHGDTNGWAGLGTVFKVNPDGTGYTVILNFAETQARNPSAGVIQGSDGALYGTTVYGPNGSTVFKLNPDGSGFSILKQFDQSTNGGNFIGLYAGLIQGADGALYGVTTEDGSSRLGTVFKLNTNGAGFTVLKNFDGLTTGGAPRAGLFQGVDGVLYGTTTQGGSSGGGTVFKLNPDGSGFGVLQNLDAATTGAYPHGELVQGADGALYGTTYYGSSSSSGTVFKLNSDGSGFRVLMNFDGAMTGGNPIGGLTQGADGALYGTTSAGGTSGHGTVFRMNPDGTGLTILENLDYSTTGGSPRGSLLQLAGGALYGTTSYGGSDGTGTVFKFNPDGTGFTVLQELSAFPPSGFFPFFAD